MRTFDIVALGELLIDYTPMPRSQAGMQVFEQNPGGAVANVLAACARLGQRAAFIGKVGQDMQGDFLRDTLMEAGIDTAGLISDPDVFTTLAFVSLDESGERSFSFARKPGADTQLTCGEIDRDIIERTEIFHFGSLSLTDDPARQATTFAAECAKRAGAIISYDPNYRAPLWKSEEEAIFKMCSLLPLVDVIKISDDEAVLLTGKAKPQEAAFELIDKGISIVAVTLGEQGALVATSEGSATISGYPAKAVDTTGAGDAFFGGFLTALGKSRKNPADVSLNEAVEFAKLANAVAALCVSGRGAIPAMPSQREVDNLMSRHHSIEINLQPRGKKL